MRFEKETLIAALVLFCLLISIAIGFIIFISSTEVKVSDAIVVYVTPYDEKVRYQEGLEPTPTPQSRLPGVFGLGYPVIINNTGGDGLRIRNAPGLDSTPLFLGNEGEGFQIIEGPALKDSIIWWRIESVSDPNRAGWAAQDYLVVVMD